MICFFKIYLVINMLYIFIEGFYDRKFFNQIYGGVFAAKQHSYIEYASLSTPVINKFIHKIINTETDSYIFFADSDGKSIESKKSDLVARYPELKKDRIVIIQFEIESWYFAGVSEEVCKQLKIKHFQFHTDDLTKEELFCKFPSRVEKIVILNTMLDFYSIPIAISRNKSLCCFNAIASGLV